MFDVDANGDGGHGGTSGAGGDEELAAPRSGGPWWRIGVGLVVAVLIAAVVIGLTRHSDHTPVAAPSTSAVHAGPVIPTFSKQHPHQGDDTVVTFDVGRHRTRAMLHGTVLVLGSSCIGRRCSAHFAVPAAVARAVRTAVPGCKPALDDLVRRGSGRSVVVQRRVACVDLPTTLLVNIVRSHARLPNQRFVSGGRLVSAAHVHGRYTVQVFLQDRGGPLPQFATAQTLADSPGLLAGI